MNRRAEERRDKEKKRTMSTQMDKDVGCPRCGAAVRTRMWPGICAQDSPELRARLLGETLFDWKCPECGCTAQLVYPCLYHDRERKFMVYLAPNGSGREFRPVDVGEKFPQLAGVKKRMVATPAEMKEKILIFEAGLDDYAVELVKYALAGVLDKKYGRKIAEGYFRSADEEGNRIRFSFFPEGQKEPLSRGTRFDAYRRSLEIAAAAEQPEDGRFVPVDALTARGMLGGAPGVREEE